MTDPRFDASARTIAVTGLGVVFVPPTIARLRITVRVVKEAPEKAAAEAGRRFEEVIAFLRARGVAESDLITTALCVGRHHEWDQKASMWRFLGEYAAHRIVTVRYREPTRVGALVVAAMALGADEVQGPTFETDAAETASDAALSAAMADARRSAEIAAACEGVAIGPVLSLAIGAAMVPAGRIYDDRFMPRSRKLRRFLDDDGQPDVPAGVIKIEETVRLVYAVA